MNFKLYNIRRNILSFIFSKRIIRQRIFWSFLIWIPTSLYWIMYEDQHSVVIDFKNKSYSKAIDLTQEYDHINEEQWEIIWAEYVKRFPKN